MGDRNTPTLEVWIDGRCSVCRRSERWCRARDRRQRLVFRDSHRDPDPPASRDRLLAAVHTRRSDGTVASGFEAWRQILLELGPWRWFARIAGLPGIRRLGAAIYSLIAANRHRITVVRG
jgi:predicted DCC family thiol-disulfide oxidoreductase YuxK